MPPRPLRRVHLSGGTKRPSAIVILVLFPETLRDGHEAEVVVVKVGRLIGCRATRPDDPWLSRGVRHDCGYLAHLDPTSLKAEGR